MSRASPEYAEKSIAITKMRSTTSLARRTNAYYLVAFAESLYRNRSVVGKHVVGLVPGLIGVEPNAASGAG